MDKILVTGGSGFIGRSLVKLLAEKGYRVTSLDKTGARTQKIVFNHENVEWVSGDTRDWTLIDSLVKGKDAVIHLAASSSFLMHEENDLDACTYTLIGFKSVMEAMKKRGTPKIVWASTSAVYEGNELPYHEKMTLNPPDSKAGCKIFCEQEARRYSDRYGIQCIGMRPFSVYGVGEHSKGGYANVISLFAWAMLKNKRPVVWGDGSQTRDFIFVEDAAKGFLAALEKNLGTQELNLGTGKETSFNQIIQIINEELDTNLDPIYVPVPIKIYANRLLADISQMKQALDFSPLVSVREGIKKVLNFARDQIDSSNLEKNQHYYLTLPFIEKAAL